MVAQYLDEYIGIRVPKPIKHEWAAKARQEHRSLSNWILTQLTIKDMKPVQDGPKRKA